jgi:hypothetical protein
MEAIMATQFGRITIDGSDLEVLARNALGPGTATPNPFIDPAVERRQREEVSAKAAAAQRRYEKDVVDLLDMIRRAAVGRAVFDEIWRQGPIFDVVIKPHLIDSFWEKEIEKWKKLSKTGPESLREYYKEKVKECEKKALEEEPNASASRAGRGGQPDRLGREGRRQKALVRFTPANWTYNPINADLGIGISFSGPGSEPDEVLLHELIHAFRYASGRVPEPNKQRKVPFQKQYDNIEEFIAILITNIYRSERGRKHLRSGHDKYFWWRDTDNDAFLAEGINRMHVRKLRTQHPRLFNALNDVKAAFNPLREFRDALV